MYEDYVGHPPNVPGPFDRKLPPPVNILDFSGEIVNVGPVSVTVKILVNALGKGPAKGYRVDICAIRFAGDQFIFKNVKVDLKKEEKEKVHSFDFGADDPQGAKFVKYVVLIDYTNHYAENLKSNNILIMDWRISMIGDHPEERSNEAPGSGPDI